MIALCAWALVLVLALVFRKRFPLLLLAVLFFLVGHSMGGLVLRAMLRDYGHDLVAQLVTIASPHRGTLLAYLSNQSDVRQMRPASRFIRELEAHEAEHGLPKTTVVLSLHDNIVAPQANQTLPGARTQAWLGHGHLSLVFRSSVWSRLMQVCDAQAIDLPRDQGRHPSAAHGRPKPRAG